MELKLRIDHYLTNRGRNPFREWLVELPTPVAARIAVRLYRFECGNLGDAKNVGDGVYEARFDFDSGYRVYFGRDGRTWLSYSVEETRIPSGRTFEKLKCTSAIIWRKKMPRRSVDWNEGLAKDLRDPEFAREFIIAAIGEEGLSPQQVLRKVILTYGLKEFSKRVRMPSSNISRVLSPKHNPTLETLNRLLKPFGLCLRVAPLEQKPAA